MNKESHKIAEELGWVSGIDYPKWGNNSLYLTTISRGYCQPGETPREAYQRLADTAAKYTFDDYISQLEIAEKFFDILWEGWLIPSSPVMSNMGTERGLPISCFSGRVGDDMYEINRKCTEMSMLSKHGGGTAYDFSAIRPIGSPIKKGLNGTSDGIIPFLKKYDSTILCSKQGATRRGAAAFYLDIQHKEYNEFLEIREPKGDVNRQCHNIHHGAVITDDFMTKVKNGNSEARKTWESTLKKRVKTGEPYLFFIDNANRDLRPGYAENNLKIWHSNLCTEIMLPTDFDHTFVCCLSAMNLAKWYEWKDTNAVQLAIKFLDAVLSEFIKKGEHIKGIEDSITFAKKSRALGLGALGFHTLLQSKMIPFGSVIARGFNNTIFNHIKTKAEQASRELARSSGEPEWCKGTGNRNLNLLAIAPNRSSAKLAGGLSQGVEPIAANAYIDDDAKGLHIRKNPILKQLLIERERDIPQVWDQIEEDRGSVKNIRCLTDEEKEVFLTFKEINQLDIVEMAGVRQKHIDQGQSINLAFPQNAPAKFINLVHYRAWELGLKALYYYRSESNLRADSANKAFDTECVACEG